MRIPTRATPVRVRFVPSEFARVSERFRVFREELLQRSGNDVRRVDEYLSRRLGSALAHFAESYLAEASSRIDRIVELRGQLAELYDSAISGRTPGREAAQNAERIFQRLAAEMRELESVRAAAEKGKHFELPPEPTGASHAQVTRQRLNRAFGAREADVAGLGAERRALLERVANLEPDLVGRVVRAEAQTSFNRSLTSLERTLQRHGMDPSDIRQALADLRELNQAHQSQSALHPASGAGRARVTELLNQLEDPTRHQADPFVTDGAPAGPARSSMEQAIEGRVGDIDAREAAARGRGSNDYANFLRSRAQALRAWVAARGGAREVARELRRAIEADPRLQKRLLESGGISYLQRMWVEYQMSGRRGSFHDYMENRSNQFWGQFGETAVGFARGEHFTFLKAPDDWVTQRGTDLVAIDRSHGNEVLIIDNKAYSSAVLESVTSLTRNIVRNLKDDVANFKRQFADRQPGSDIDVAIGRLEKAANEIEADPLVKAAWDPARQRYDPNIIEQPHVQQRINAILKANNVRRVVTGEGGILNAVSSDLKNLGIDFYP